MATFVKKHCGRVVSQKVADNREKGAYTKVPLSKLRLEEPATTECKTNQVTEILFEAPSEDKKDDYVYVPAGELAMEDEFLKHEPRVGMESAIKEGTQRFIENGPRDFWYPKLCFRALFTEGEYWNAYLAVLIKKRVAFGLSIKAAWNRVYGDLLCMVLSETPVEAPEKGSDEYFKVYLDYFGVEPTDVEGCLKVAAVMASMDICKGEYQ